MENPENMTISSAKQFKKEREAREKGEVVTLSSGLSVLLRRPEVSKLIAKGLIPNTLLTKFMKIQKEGTDNMSADDFASLIEYQREMAKHSMLKPMVGDEADYDNERISFDDLSENDLAEITQYVNGGTEQLESFRNGL